MGIDRDWWVPLERFIAPERRLFSVLLIFSLAAHVAGMALVGSKSIPDTALPFGGPSVTLMPARDAVGAGSDALRLSLRLDDPSAIALPRLNSLFAHAVPPSVGTAPLAPAEPESLIGANQILPAEVGGLAEMAGRMPLGRPQLATARVPNPPAAVLASGVLVGSGLAERFVGDPMRLDPVRVEGKLEGPTVVSVGVAEDGMVHEAVVVASCGSPEQDAEALRLVRGLRFAPSADRGVLWAPVAFYWADANPESGKRP